MGQQLLSLMSWEQLEGQLVKLSISTSNTYPNGKRTSPEVVVRVVGTDSRPAPSGSDQPCSEMPLYQGMAAMGFDFTRQVEGQWMLLTISTTIKTTTPNGERTRPVAVETVGDSDPRPAPATGLM
jgi:hypothetical protein